MIYERKANYYETDQMAIIHHSNYIRWFEEARIVFMERMGFPYELMEAAGIQIPVLEMHCVYKTMVRFGDTVEIEVRLVSYTGARMELCYAVHDKVTGELRTTGASKHCFIHTGGKAVSLRRALPEAHAIFLQNVEKAD